MTEFETIDVELGIFQLGYSKIIYENLCYVTSHLKIIELYYWDYNTGKSIDLTIYKVILIGHYKQTYVIII